MNNGIDVGALTQDLTVQIMPNARHCRTVENFGTWNIGNHDVLDAHLFQRNLSMFGIGNPVAVTFARCTQRHISQGVVNVAPPRYKRRITQKPLANGGCLLYTSPSPRDS